MSSNFDLLNVSIRLMVYELRSKECDQITREQCLTKIGHSLVIINR